MKFEKDVFDDNVGKHSSRLHIKFISHEFKHVFWVLKKNRLNLSRWENSFEYPQHMFW